ncbi:MAG: hypothetical protein LBG96_07480 [Tannerella sp.]|jgi:hypothetical protein|nr:hypothetical protein [Tannerella sp.]
MAAGLKYELDPRPYYPEFCRFETVYRLAGGFNLVTDNLEQGAKIPPLAPLSIDFATRKATVVKNVRVVEDAAVSSTTIKIAKGSLAYAGMIVGTGSAGATVSSIDKSNPDYDVITLSAAFGAATTKGKILFEASAAGGTTVKNKANFLNYAWTKVEPGATVDGVGRAFEVKESKLIAPIADKDKDTLKGVYIFIS